MWCANCQDDVATEISANGQALKCITCGEDVREVFAPSLHPETKSARDLLQKWAEEQKQKLKEGEEKSDQVPLEPNEVNHSDSTPIDSKDVNKIDSKSLETASQSSEQQVDSKTELEHHVDNARPVHESPQLTSESSQPTNTPKSASRPKFRIDAAHEELNFKMPAKEKRETQSVVPEQAHRVASTNEVENLAQARNQPAVRNYDHHGAHEQVAAPHFDVVAASKKAKARPGRSEAIWGQLMAYAGVGVLTVGTIMVLWGYFGMVEQYASTGWLLSTAGQMLLLLGIVTLVSGGMQQTTHEVTERIEYLGGRMIRIEQSTDQLLNGPHFSETKHASAKVVQSEKGSNTDS